MLPEGSFLGDAPSRGAVLGAGATALFPRVAAGKNAYNAWSVYDVTAYSVPLGASPRSCDCTRNVGGDVPIDGASFSQGGAGSWCENEQCPPPDAAVQVMRSRSVGPSHTV